MAAIILGAMSFAAIIIIKPPGWKPGATASLAVTLSIVFLYVKLIKSIITARLIIENQIIHIRPVVFHEQGKKSRANFLPVEPIEVFVSCFGILLDSKIIKFNQDGIKLKAVEIGRDFISLAYGTRERTQTTRLLRAAMDNGELDKITERFRYETGVVPSVSI